MKQIFTKIRLTYILISITYYSLIRESNVSSRAWKKYCHEYKAMSSVYDSVFASVTHEPSPMCEKI